jgi:uncharacterized protein YbjT (DUF2867 family)
VTYLITGATGPIGRNLVLALLQAGHAVRVTTRSPEKANFPAEVEVVVGDFTTGDLPHAAFANVTAAFVFPALGGIDRFLTSVQRSSIERLVVLSSLAAAGAHERDRGSASSLHHSAIEAAVAATDIPATVLRPGDMANNLLYWSWPIKTAGTVYAPYGDSAQAPIHEADVAAVAAVALTGSGHAGKLYPMTGPQAITRRQQLATIGAAIGRNLTYVEIEPEQFAEQMAAYMAPDIIKMLLDYWSDTVAQPDEVLTTVQDVTGRPARSLAQWAADHASDFAS